MSEKSNEEKGQPVGTNGAQQTKMPSTDRRNFLKYAGAGVAGIVVGAAVEYPILNGQIQADNAQISTLQGQVTSLTNQVSGLNGQINTLNGQITSLNGQITTLNGQLTADQQQISGLQAEVTMGQGLTTLSINESKTVEAMVEAIIPSDSGGPGGKEAGVLYFIDRQLTTDYGKSANMYTKGPYVPQGLSGPVTVGGITYPGGTASVPFAGGQRLQYAMDMREFWRQGLASLQAYSNSAYNGNFETLTTAQQVQALTDLFNNKPTTFGAIMPQDFFNEVIFMVWSGFLMDPLYGGNANMVGWKHVAFNGVNMGNFYGEGLHTTDLMVASTPTRIQPASLAQFQKGSG